MSRDFRQGDLVLIVRKGSFTLGQALQTHPPSLRECPVRELEVSAPPAAKKTKDIFQHIEGKVGLVVYVTKNRLNQVMGYDVLIEGKKMFCKSNVANKYFDRVDPEDASRRLSKV